MCTRWSLKQESGDAGRSPSTPRTTQLVALLSTSPPIAVQLQHRDDPVGLLQPHVRDVAEAGLALGELCPWWRAPAACRASAGSRPRPRAARAVVADPYAAGRSSSSIGSPISATTSRKWASGWSTRAPSISVTPRKSDVGGVQRGGGEAEGGRADVRRQGELGGARPSGPARSRSGASRRTTLDLEPEVPHHRRRSARRRAARSARPRPRSWSGRSANGRERSGGRRSTARGSRRSGRGRRAGASAAP